MRPPAPKLPGTLELLVLSALWDSRETLSVRDVLDRVKGRHPIAYTTVLTVLDRLHDKGLVAREKHGKAFSYWPRISREAWQGAQAARVLTATEQPPDRSVLLAFVESAERADPQLLDRLSALIAQRRRGGGA